MKAHSDVYYRPSAVLAAITLVFDVLSSTDRVGGLFSEDFLPKDISDRIIRYFCAGPLPGFRECLSANILCLGWSPEERYLSNQKWYSGWRNPPPEPFAGWIQEVTPASGSRTRWHDDIPVVIKSRHPRLPDIDVMDASQKAILKAERFASYEWKNADDAFHKTCPAFLIQTRRKVHLREVGKPVCWGGFPYDSHLRIGPTKPTVLTTPWQRMVLSSRIGVTMPQLVAVPTPTGVKIMSHDSRIWETNRSVSSTCLADNLRKAIAEEEEKMKLQFAKWKKE